MNETELIGRCINKEKQAWDIFVERYSRLIYWAIRKRLKASSFTFSEDDVQNIFQEVFLSILEGEKLTQLRDAKLICSWLAMIASNKAFDFMRGTLRNKQRFIADVILLKNKDCEQNLSDRETINILENIINTLSDREKIIISLNLLEEKTHKEISGILGIPINTASTIIARTKEKIKKELGKYGISGQSI
ncbi:MAG: sigma-70 family RNA polymerase sigma factor [Candidatus Omnitrophica bacterium]|jgi:RNA polymerase sigma-70 factor (ECF subfamily)|nr:sigma-70 family RNA polymerase sigma factor [Candidatus Omnitrophota bacterium]